MATSSAGAGSNPVGAASEIDVPGRARAGRRFRFGEYEAQPEAGLLLKSGHRVRIQDLPFRMLLVLLDTPGEIVSREELRQRLWGEKTFVEFDNNLRVAAAKLREALRDNVSEPRHIETIARRGYRFLTPVEIIDPSPHPPDERTPVAVILAAPVPVSALAAGQAKRNETAKRSEKPSQSAQHEYRTWAFALTVAALLIGLTSWVVWRWRHQPLLREGDTVALGSVRNETGDASLDDTLTLAFRVKMEESPFLHAVSSEQFDRESEALQANPAHRLTVAAAQRSVCASAGGKLLLGGQIRRAGMGLKVRLSAERCSDGKEVASTETSAGSPEALLDALGDVANQLRLRLGETPTMLGRFDVPAGQATTSSLAALRAFREGEKKHFAGDDLGSREDYKLAIDLDPNFAIAYVQLGKSYSNVGELSLSQAYFQKAFGLRDRTTDREKLYIATSYYSRGVGEVDRAIGAYELWESLYPHDVVPANNLATEYYLLGDGEKSLAAARRAIAIEPTLSVPYSTLAQALFITGELHSLTTLCDEKQREATSFMGMHLACYKLAIVEGDLARKGYEERLAHGTPLECPLLNEAAEAEFYAGHVHRAKEILSVAVEEGRAHGLPELAAIVELNGAAIVAEVGDSKNARALIADTWSYASAGTETDAGAAMTWAILGENAKARTLVNATHAMSPTDTMINQAELPVINAILELRAGHAQAARETLDPVRPYDLNTSMELMSVYYRGRALQALDERKGSIEEFEHVLTHARQAPRSIYIALSELELAKLYASEGQIDRARKMSTELAETWKTADPHFAPLRELQGVQALLDHAK